MNTVLNQSQFNPELLERLGIKSQKAFRETLANVPEFRVSERHAHLMARKVIDALRRKAALAEQRFTNALDNSLSRSMGKKAFNVMRDVFLKRLGAFELNSNNRKQTSIYYLEVGGEGDDTIYLCSANISRKKPLESCSFGRRVALTKHALERAFLRSCIWLKGESVQLFHIIKEMLDVLLALTSYQLAYFSECSRLIDLGWNMNLSDTRTQYILRFDNTAVPVVMTVYKAEEETPEGGIAKMIPPEGSFGNPKLLANLNQLVTKPAAMSA
jgi:hypothetical protein